MSEGQSLTLHAGWHHSSGAPCSSFCTCSCCHLHGRASMCRSQASFRSFNKRTMRIQLGEFTHNPMQNTVKKLEGFLLRLGPRSLPRWATCDHQSRSTRHDRFNFNYHFTWKVAEITRNFNKRAFSPVTGLLLGEAMAQRWLVWTRTTAPDPEPRLHYSWLATWGMTS